MESSEGGDGVVTADAQLPPLVSIVVNNYNYARYLPVALDSALAQGYPRVEVIVVDDGSTDGSPQILAGYEDRVRVLHQRNAGQPAACEAGFDASSGDIVMFLDADDFLFPAAAAEVAAAWQPSCGKVQFRLALVDADGVAFGTDPPWTVPLPHGDLTEQLRATGYYETPVTSGNAFSRTLLKQLFPTPAAFNAIDAYVNTVAPLHGPVVSIDKELGAYRQHASNRWAYSGGVGVNRLRERVVRDLVKERELRAHAAQLGVTLAEGLSLRQPDHVLHRLASLRLDPAGHPLRGDRRITLLRAGARAVRARTELPAADRAVQLVILATVALLPRRPAGAVVAWAVGGGRRPEWLRRLARVARGMRGRPPAEPPPLGKGQP